MFPAYRLAFLLAVVVCLSPRALWAASSHGIDQRPSIGAFLTDRLPQSALIQTGNWAVVEAFPNLPIEDPVSMVPEPGTNRLFVVTRQGQVFSFVNDPEVSHKTEFLNLTNVTQGWDDCGMFGFAFHPEYGQPGSTNRGYVYIWYRYSPSPVPGPSRPPVRTPGYNRLSRFTVPDGSPTADRSSELVLINQFDRDVWHDGGGMFFGLDRFLYIGVGDEGASFDFYNNSQTISRGFFSGVLRIDVDCNPERSHPIRRQPEQPEQLPPGFTEGNYSAHYYIPKDNPFLDPEGGVLEEFWAIGIRNPHRMTQDPITGRIWEGDIGQNLWEEVNIIERGGNYQWAYREGFHPVTNRGVVIPKPPPEKLIGIEKPPLYEYAHGTEGRCVIGGYVYRGKAFEAELGGKYIFGDNGSGRIWAVTWDGTNAPTVEYLCNMPPGSGYTGLSTFGVDHDNEIYIGKMGRPSKIYKLARADELTRTVRLTFRAPERLSGLAAFASLSSLTPAAGLIPYDVNSPLWSDGSLKRRWMALPDGKRIQFSPTNEWHFPEGTVFIKHFELPVNEVTGAIRRLETRFLVRDTQDGVYGFTYRWRESGAEAELVESSFTEDIRIVAANGLIRTQRWFYPGPQDCLVCHTPNAGHVLGVNARQLNGAFTYPESGVTANQLKTWNHLGLFDSPQDEASLATLPALAAIDDAQAPLELRARSYLDANCSHCHRPNAVGGYFDARFDTPLSHQGLVDGRLVNSMEIPGSRVVAPGDLSRSILHIRAGLLGDLQMPPLAKNVVDTNAVSVLAEWIRSLER